MPGLSSKTRTRRLRVGDLYLITQTTYLAPQRGYLARFRIEAIPAPVKWGVVPWREVSPAPPRVVFAKLEEAFDAADVAGRERLLLNKR